MNIPSKIKKGDQLRSVAVDTINSLIDYLASTRIVQGMGIRLQQYAHGTVITALPGVTSASSAAAPAYNGYFTIKDVSTYNKDGTVQEFRVAVCDGETWDAETQTSGDSIAYCMGNDIQFKSTILTLTESSDIYIKCGPANTYFNRIVHQRQGTTKPSRLGYEYLIVGTVRIQNGALSIIQRLMGANNGGSVYVPYAQYTDDFALRLLEDETTDSVISDKAAICNGMTWNPRTQTSGASYCTVNGVNERGMPGAVVIDFTYNHSVYLYSKWHDRGRPPAIEVISTTTQLTMSEPGVYGYIMIATAGKHYPPYSGVYNIFWFNIGCVGEYAVVEDEEGKS